MHEALARAWPRFATWQAEGRDDRALHERLRSAAAAWHAAGRRADLLWRASLLEELARFREVYEDLLTDLERQFADAAVRAHRSSRRRQLAAGVGPRRKVKNASR